MEEKIEKFACLQFKFLYHERHEKKRDRERNAKPREK